MQIKTSKRCVMLMLSLTVSCGCVQLPFLHSEHVIFFFSSSSPVDSRREYFTQLSLESQ